MDVRLRLTRCLFSIKLSIGSCLLRAVSCTGNDDWAAVYHWSEASLRQIEGLDLCIHSHFYHESYYWKVSLDVYHFQAIIEGSALLVKCLVTISIIRSFPSTSLTAFCIAQVCLPLPSWVNPYFSVANVFHRLVHFSSWRSLQSMWEATTCILAWQFTEGRSFHWSLSGSSSRKDLTAWVSHGFIFDFCRKSNHSENN